MSDRNQVEGRVVNDAVTILPGMHLRPKLSKADHAELLEWFRSNGIDPNRVLSGERVVIDQVIDCWQYGGKPSPETVLGFKAEASAEPLYHLSVPVKVPLPDHLATQLRAIRAELDAHWRRAEDELRAAGIFP